MHVLNLVTTPRPFFRRQVDVLEQKGVETTTVKVPGEHDPDQGQSRSVTDYMRFYPHVLRKSLDGVDIVHANYGLTAPVALAQPRRPVVLSLWGSDLFGRYGEVSRRVANYCDAVVVMSEEMAAEFDRDADVIPHGIDLTQFKPMPASEARDSVGWDEDIYHVLFPYSPERPEKDYPRASRVVERVDDRLDRPVSLEIVTDVPHERVPIYMNAADALLLTSKHEGSPNAVREALACNLPVVATDVGDVANRLANIQQSAIGETDTDLVRNLVAVLESEVEPNGRAAVQDVSLDRMGDRLIDVYRRVA
jgi:glycosyltransferase involved in cell wall biosynthesis